MIYLDNSATTMPCESCVSAVSDALTKYWGNPSSLHRFGAEASELIRSARKTVAGSLGAGPDEIYFSPSGTAAVNTALFGAVKLKKGRGKRIITSAVEHPCTTTVLAELEHDGYEIVRIRCGAEGLDVNELKAALTPDVILVTMMYVNNELGTILPVEKLRASARENGADPLIHIDAVQAYGKIPVKVRSLNCDLLSVSAHKVHGPKGVGALYVRKGLHLRPYIIGGGQENGLFSGTENVAAISGFSAAVNEFGDMTASLVKAGEKKAFLMNLLNTIDGVVINSSDGSLPYIINFSLTGVPAEVTVNYLSSKGICVSSGSACHRGRRSDVLTAAGFDPARIDSAIRISTSKETTTDELRAAAAALSEAAERFRR